MFVRPEDFPFNVEYLNPSFLIKKRSGGYRLVTAFANVGSYSKPQPSLMPDVDNTLRKIAQWKYTVTTDMSNAFYQIPLSQESMKYRGVVTPFRGAYTLAQQWVCPGLKPHSRNCCVAYWETYSKKTSSPNWQTTYIVEETPSPNSNRP